MKKNYSQYSFLLFFGKRLDLFILNIIKLYPKINDDFLSFVQFHKMTASEVRQYTIAFISQETLIFQESNLRYIAEP